MRLDIESCGTPDKKKHSQSFLHPAFYGLIINTLKLLHPQKSHMHEGLLLVNHEEYSQESRRDP